MSKRWRNFCVVCFVAGMVLGIAIGAPSSVTILSAIVSLSTIPLGYWTLREHDKLDQFMNELIETALTGGRRGN